MKIAKTSLPWYWRLVRVPGLAGIDTLDQDEERLTVTITFYSRPDKRRFWGWLLLMAFEATGTREVEAKWPG